LGVPDNPVALPVKGPTKLVAVTIPVTSKELAVAIPRDDVCSVTTVEYAIPLPGPGYDLPVPSRVALTGVIKETFDGGFTSVPLLGEEKLDPEL
jgi:hypothetical protein